MRLTLIIEDRDNFSGHVNEDVLYSVIDDLLVLLAKDLYALDPDHHRYIVRRDK